MYTGITTRKKTTKKRSKKEFPYKFQMLQNEEIESNGVITKQLVFKTHEYKQDKTISWKDFEIANLIAAGIDPKTLPTVQLPADIEKLSAQAAATETQLDRYEIIKQIEMEEQNNEPTTKQAQQ